jgi:hypothetical protein
MSAFAAILRREIALRATLLPVALFLGLAPFAVPLFGIPDRQAAAVFFIGAVGVVAIALTGGAVIVSDLAEGRLGFFFTLPVPWWAIWAGKMGAALLVTSAAIALVLAPSALSGDVLVPAPEWFVRILLPLLIAGIGCVHFGTMMLRSRDGWAVLDIVLLGLTIGTAAAMALLIPHIQGLVDSYWLATILLWTLAAIVAIGTALQIREARTDIVRGHRVLASVVWCGIALVAAIGAVRTVRLLHPRPSDLVAVRWAMPAPAGSWAVVGGATRRGSSLGPGFIVETSSGRWVDPSFDFRPPTFSADGRWAVWRHWSWIHGQYDGIAVADLQATPPEVRQWPWREKAHPDASLDVVNGLAVAPRGERALVSFSDRTCWIDLRSGTVTPAGRAGDDVLFGSVVVFAADRARWLRYGAPARRGVDSREVELVEVSPNGEKALGRFTVGGLNATVRWSPAAERFVITERYADGPMVTDRDGATGAVRAVVLARGAARMAVSEIASDGSVAVVSTGVETRLTLAAPGVEIRTIALGYGRRAGVAEVAPGLLAATAGGSDGADTILVEAATGRIVRREWGLRVADVWGSSFGGVRFERPRPLFLDGDTLVELDLATGARRRLLPND